MNIQQRVIQRGQIYFVDLNPIQGREQSGERPVLVVSVDSINRLPLVVSVVVGSKGANEQRDYPTTVRLTTAETGLPMETLFYCFQIRSLDHARFPDNPSGQVSRATMRRVETALRYCLGL